MKKFIKILLIMVLLPMVAFATEGKVELKNTCPGSLLGILLLSSDAADPNGEFGGVSSFVKGQSHTFDTDRDIDMTITGVLEPDSSPLDNIRPGDYLEIFENHEGEVVVAGIHLFTKICRIRKFSHALVANAEVRINQGQLPIPGGGEATQQCLNINGDTGVIAENDVVSLKWQDDGNLVMYIQNTDTPIWSSGTVGNATDLCFQSDGNLVIYNNGAPTWATGSLGGEILALQTDCNLVIYDGGGAPLWNSRTSCPQTID